MKQITRRALRQRLIRRLTINAGIVTALVLAALTIGATGYHHYENMPWLDAALNAAMILTGMGPATPIQKPATKLFAIGYALFSGVFFLTMVALLLAPALHHFLHRFHLDLNEDDSSSARHRTSSERGREPVKARPGEQGDRQTTSGAPR